jgi:hypothetical protein
VLRSRTSTRAGADWNGGLGLDEAFIRPRSWAGRLGLMLVGSDG